jgi:hypothetical protein
MPDRQTVHLFADRIVFLAELQQLAHLAFELLVLVAQRQHLAFGDRDRSPPMRMRNDHIGDQIRVLLEEPRIVCRYSATSSDLITQSLP